jgi:NitT/TauT family transport system permease protein
MTRSGRSASALIGVIPIALIIGIWQAIAASGLAPPSILPPPAAVFARLVQQLGSPAYLDHVATTLFRLFTGFAIAAVIGVTIGVAATGSRAVEAIVQPLVRVLAPVPKIAL